MILQPNLIQGEGQRLQRLLPDLRLQLTFPNSDAMPTHIRQHLLLLNIPLLISSDLRHPELPISLRNLATLRILSLRKIHMMAVPKASVNKNARSIFPQHQIRMSWQLWRIKPLSESSLPQSSAHNHLRLRVLPTNCRHILVPLFCREFIHSRPLLILPSSNRHH